jgi:ABC-type lipoprotein release transport system permease subunit
VEVDVKAGGTAAADRVRVDNARACPLVQMLPWILYGGGIATLLSLVAAVVPVRIAAKVEPAAAMRYEV